MATRELDQLWVKQASGLYVPFHEITGWSSASVGDYLAKGTDDTLQMVSAVTGGGASTGTGSPEGVVTAAVGAFYVQTDASTASDGVWYKQTGAGNTGWVQIVASAGTGGGVTVLYDSGALASPANSIDTGAGGIAGGYDVLEIWAVLRTDETVANSGCHLRFNNDSTAGNYQRQRLTGANTTASAGIGGGSATSVDVGVAGANCATGDFSIVRCTIPFYTETTAHKAVEVEFGNPDDTDANKSVQINLARWKDAAAITRLSLTAPAGKNFVAGSHVIVYGR